MRPELERLQQIEQHLLARPAPTEAAQWQARLLLDAALAEDVATQQQLYQGIQLAGRQQLRRELHQIHAQLYRPRRGWMQAALARLRHVLPWPPRLARR